MPSAGAGCAPQFGFIGRADLHSNCLTVQRPQTKMGERHFAQGGSRVSPRPARYLFFASPKKSTQKKGDPAVRDPVLRTGQPAVLAPGRVSLNSRYALKQTRALIRPPLRFSARPQGLWATENQTSSRAYRCARPVWLSRSRPLWMRLWWGACGVACARVRACFVDWLAVAV